MIKKGDYVMADVYRGPEWYPVDQVTGTSVWVMDGDGCDYEVEFESVLDHHTKDAMVSVLRGNNAQRRTD